MKWSAYFETPHAGKSVQDSPDLQGVGVYVDIADDLTAYRRKGDPSGKGSCSYLAPIVTKKLNDMSSPFKYNAYFTIGTLDEIKKRFNSIKGGDGSSSDSSSGGRTAKSSSSKPKEISSKSQ